MDQLELLKKTVEGLKRAKGKGILAFPPFFLKASFDVLVPIGAGYFVEGDLEGFEERLNKFQEAIKKLERREKG